MPKAKVVRTGQNDDQPWAALNKNVNGFIMSGYVHPEEPLEEGTEVEIPSQIDAGIEWRA